MRRNSCLISWLFGSLMPRLDRTAKAGLDREVPCGLVPEAPPRASSSGSCASRKALPTGPNGRLSSPACMRGRRTSVKVSCTSSLSERCAKAKPSRPRACGSGACWGNRRLAKAVGGAGMSEMIRRLDCKYAWYSRGFVKVGDSTRRTGHAAIAGASTADWRFQSANGIASVAESAATAT